MLTRNGFASALILCIILASAASPAWADGAQYVISISVDGMGSYYVTPLLTSGLTNELTTFEKFQAEGAGTLNARDDYNYAVTLPNHATMVTSRGVLGASGHGWTRNGWPDGSASTFEEKKGSYVASVFDVVHNNSLRTGLWAGKTKFALFTDSYDAADGAPDNTGVDNGPAKIDYSNISSGISAKNLTDDFLAQMTANPMNYSFVHYQDPDAAGHNSSESGWSTDPTSYYAATLKAVDTQIARIFDMVENSATLAGKTAIIITADHGGHNHSHGDTTNPLDYTIPFYVWGPGVTAGGDLYDMNLLTRTEPGSNVNPPYTGGQPVRNGDLGNLSLDLLGLGAIPGSTIDADQDLAVPEPATLFVMMAAGLPALLRRRQKS